VVRISNRNQEALTEHGRLDSEQERLGIEQKRLDRS
jgi:hypothetical protein